MKGTRLWLAGAVALLSLFAVACGGGGGNAVVDNPNGGGGGGAAGILPASGESLPPQFMTFEGESYELVTLRFEEELEGQLELVGEAEGSQVFRKPGEATTIYTYVEANVEDPGHYLVWELVS